VLDVVLIVNDYLINQFIELLLDQFGPDLFLQHTTSSFFDKIVHFLYFLVNTVDRTHKLEIQVFEHKSEHNIIEPDQQVHVATETTQYDVFDT